MAAALANAAVGDHIIGGLEAGLAGGALRVSFGYGSTDADAKAFIAAWRRLAGAEQPSGRVQAAATSN